MSENKEKALEQVKKEIRQMVEENFKPLMDYSSWQVKSSQRVLEVAKEIEHMYKYRLKDVTGVKDLELITVLITRLTEQLLDLAMLQYRILGELKDAHFT